MQPNATSIQQIIQEAVAVFAQEEVAVVGSGRTDAGVHALNQVAHFTSSSCLDTQKLFRALNGILPKDIRCLKAIEVPMSFHAQQSAISKEYHYILGLDEIVTPFQRLYCQHIAYKLDIELLKQAAALFVGTHDFSSFANSQHHGAAQKNPVRTIYRIDVVPWQEGIRLEFEGNGFLYKMVRNIVGMLLQVASKKRPLEDIAYLFEVKDRKQGPIAASARGLFLVKVNYPNLM